MSDEEHVSVRAALHDAIQATNLDEDLDGAMLMGYVAVAEWMAPDGKRWLSCVHGSATRGRAAAQWQVEGYLHNALFDGFFGEPE